MLIKRSQINNILKLISQLKERKFNITTQYKLIKVEKAILEEQQIFQEQIQANCSEFFERDESGRPLVNENGGYKIKKEKIDECYNLMNKMTSLQVQIPDIYFSLEELSELGLTLGELEPLEPFIKN